MTGSLAAAAPLPTPRSSRGAYLAAARISARHVLSARGEVVGRVVFLAVFLLVFSRLWRAVPLGGAAGDPRGLLWYLAITEWVLLSVPSVHLHLERDVRTGDHAHLLARPVSWAGMRVAEAIGALLVRMATLGVVGVPLAWALAGGLPEDPRALPLAVPLGVAAGVLGVLAQAAIGLCAVWIHDVSPVYWIWQKLAFVLGGLVLPLDLYPGWLRAVAAWSPFAAFLNGPGRQALGLDPAGAARAGVAVAAWLVLAAAVLAAVAGRARRALDVAGG